MSVIAVEDTNCLALGREVLFKLLGEKVEDIIYRNLSKWAIEKNEKLKDLTISQIDKILDNVKINKLKKS